MTDSMKFGPEWLRNMKSDTSLGSGAGGGGVGATIAPTVPLAPLKLAEFRYGREEMLALFDPKLQPPESFRKMHSLFIEKIQPPLAFSQLSEEETSIWNRGVNSDGALRQSKPVGVPGVRGVMGGRGGSVDRGRGRARGSYHYSRGLSYEESEPPNGFNRGMRGFDRTQSQGGWSERNGGDPGDFTATSPRKEFSGRPLSDTNWRRHRGSGEEDSGWRASRTEKWGRGGSNSWREGDSGWDRTRSWEEGSNNSSHPPPRRPWDNDESNLPEWATENPSESGGSFDATGAFHGGTPCSDEEDGLTNHNHRSSRTEEASTHRDSTGQPRPDPTSKKEPPNISNGPVQPRIDSGPGDSEGQRSSSGVRNSNSGSSSGSAVPLRQSQSASSLARPIAHPLTSSASFSGVNSHSSHVREPTDSKPRRDEPQTKPSSIMPQQQRTQPRPQPPNITHEIKKPLDQVTVPVSVPVPVTENRQPVKTNHEEEFEQRVMDTNAFVLRLIKEEERDSPPPSIVTSTTPPTSAHPHTHHPHTIPLADTLWYYQDPQGNVQGPFQSSEMAEWYNSGYFKGNLLVRRACDERYSSLQTLVGLWNGVPFTGDYFAVPPLKNTEPIMPDSDSAFVHFHLQQQLIMQRQALAKLNQTEPYNSISLEQQKLLAHQAQMEASLHAGLLNQHAHPPTNTNVMAMLHQLAQYQQMQQQRVPGQVPVSMPVSAPVEPPMDPVQQIMQQMGLQSLARGPAPPQSAPTPQTTPEEQRNIEQFMAAFRQRQATAQPPPQPQPTTMESVWGASSTWSVPPSQPSTPQSLWADPGPMGIKTEQEVLEEQLRVEEKKKEELRKHEELQRLKKKEDEEKERQRRQKEEEEHERKRKEEEEREKQREKKRLQEEEDQKKKEAAAAKKAEQDKLKKEEEKRKKEEDKRRKEEDKRKQEEERKRAEEEMKKQEEERKRREEMTKRQNEALKRLQEQQQQARAVKPAPTPAPWIQPEPAAASLADIQKTERKQQQQLREQQEMLKAFQEKHQQEQQQQLKASKSGTSLNLKWAENAKSQPARVKSLAEIQAEEQEQMTKQAEKEKAERMAAVKEVTMPATASIWTNQNLTWNSTQQTASVWGNSAVSNAVSGSGAKFFEEVSSKTSKATKNAAAQQPAKSQAKTKAKKDEASVMKLFEKQLPKTSKTDDFNKWCTKTLVAIAGNVDIPTFVEFLLTVETQKEVKEYTHMYIGETKEANDFASEFIDRRSRLLSNERPEPPTSNANLNHFQEVKGKNKKAKKNKMMKVDSRILGFNVTAAPDRINVGDRDFVEGL